LSDRFPLITEAAMRNRISSFAIDGEAVLLGITANSISPARAPRRGYPAVRILRVITNNLNMAAAFAQNPDMEITIVGGTLHSLDRDIIGDAVVRFSLPLRALSGSSASALSG
jgi:DeoR family glycerol-3-phosphate regulon repressor